MTAENKESVAVLYEQGMNPEDYTLIGTQAEQKKFIGNAVEVNMARVLCEALCKKL